MGELTAQQLGNLFNAAQDFYFKGPAMAQSIQDRPTLAAFKPKQKTFPGGKEMIRGNVKGDYTTQFMGYSYDDPVTYKNPANIKQFSYEAQFELHAGISVTYSELKKDGISVVDSLNGEQTSEHSQRDKTVITGIFQDKLDDMAEGSARSFNDILMLDGAQDAKVFPGIRSIITDDPTTGIVGGIDRAANPWWRHRALVGASKVTHSATNQTLTKALRSEVRQLRRYGGKPTFLPCGSGFIEKLEAEIHEKGVYTQTGFVNNGSIDLGSPDITMKGVGKFVYDPWFDDNDMTNHCMFLDLRHIFLDVMEGEDMKKHAPARPAEIYALYRAVTWTGTLIANKMNCHGLYEAA